MKVLLVDDEPFALIGLQRALESEISGIEIAETYTDAQEAIAGALKHLPELVFLDIHMPEMDGLQLGREIQAAVPGVEIVFVTGYDRYAVRAFELYALDYIMKPPQRQRLRQTIMKVQEKMSLKGARQAHVTDAPMICCLNHIRFQHPGMEPVTVKWRTSKAQELFAYLLHHRDRTVSRGALLELLWPDIDEAKAAQHLYTAIYHIRRTLKAYDFDMVSIRIGELEVGYRLELGEARIESEVWENDLKRLGVLDADNADVYERVLESYTGDYLGNYEYLWAEHERERYRLLWLYQMKQLSAFYERQGLPEKAIRINRRLQQICPNVEESYFSLMKLYHKVGNKGGVEEQFWLLKKMMEDELELPIRMEIIRWYEQWKLGDSAARLAVQIDEYAQNLSNG